VVRYLRFRSSGISLTKILNIRPVKRTSVNQCYYAVVAQCRNARASKVLHYIRHRKCVSFGVRPLMERSRLVLGRLFLRPSDSLRVSKLQNTSVRPPWLCSDQNVRRNCTACHANLFTVFARLNAEWEFYGKACICSVFVRFSNIHEMFLIW